MSRVAALLAVAVALMTGTSSAMPAFEVGEATAPAPPANLEVTARTQDSLTLAWGPSTVSDFRVVDAGRRFVLAGWTESQDTRGVKGYNVTRDDGTPLATVAVPQYRITVGAKQTSARICVVPVNANDQTGPVNCGTFTR